MGVTLQKSKYTWKDYTGVRLVVSTVAPLEEMGNFL